MSDKLNIGIIGVGGIAQVVHLPILSKFSNVKIGGISELNKSRLNTIANKYGITNKYQDYRQLLDDKSIDAVIIATPTDTHHNIALDCVSAGKNILIEKPIARNYTEAEEIITKADAAGVKVMVGMNLRFRPDAMLLRSLINSGDLGKIFYVRCRWIRKQSSNQAWFMKREQAGGGVIIDLGIVLLDLVLWLMGYRAVKSVSVQKFYSETTNVEDSAVGLIRLSGESAINFEASWSLQSEKDSFQLSAFCEKGNIHLNPLRAFRKIGDNEIDYTPTSGFSDKNMFKKSYENELKHFITSIHNDSLPLISSGKEALLRMNLLEGIYKSAELGREINLDEK